MSSRPLSAEKARRGPLGGGDKACNDPPPVVYSPSKEPETGDRDPPGFQSPAAKENCKPDTTQFYLTPEQRDRIEKNRLRALERRLRSPTRPNNNLNGAFKATSDSAAAKVTPSLTPEQRRRTEENRKRALERRAALETKQKVLKPAQPPCLRCGSDIPSSLCIDWKHSAELQRERNPFSTGRWNRDIFRYDCCNRLAPQPCYIGLHDFSFPGKNPGSVTLSSCVKKVQECHCNRPAHLKRTRKDGLNVGRYFFRCNSEGKPTCDFFAWADQVFNLPPQRPVLSPDGIKEWICLYANPFDEKLAFEAVVDQAQARKRVIAALIIHEMIHEICGGRGGFVCTSPHLGELEDKVLKIWEEKAIVKCLSPLTRSQIVQRFGCQVIEELDKPTKEEIEECLRYAIQSNKVLRSTVELQTDSAVTPYVDLSGLEAYIAV
jgi:hypothetical protein